MEFNKKQENKSQTPVSSIIMYVSSVIVFLIGIASLINNIRLFNLSVNSYVKQGYKKHDVMSTMVPSQLLPAVFQAVALYFGVAVVLIIAGIINKKITKTLELLSNNKPADSVVVEEINNSYNEAAQTIVEQNDEDSQTVDEKDNI